MRLWSSISLALVSEMLVANVRTRYHCQIRYSTTMF